MALKKLTIEHADGKIECITGAELDKYVRNFARCISHSKIHGIDPFGEDPITWTEVAPEFKLQRVYFALVEEIAKNTNSGNSKDSLHAALKPMLFTKIQDNVANFKDNVVVHSTKNLTHKGWISLIEQLKEIAKDVFGYVTE